MHAGDPNNDAIVIGASIATAAVVLFIIGVSILALVIILLEVLAEQQESSVSHFNCGGYMQEF